MKAIVSASGLASSEVMQAPVHFFYLYSFKVA
jgi:hypothetical protein